MLTNKSYLDCKKINTAIIRAKNLLEEYASKHGIYENFGQKQVWEIRNKFIDISDYSDKMNSDRIRLSSFSSWCSTYNILDMKQYAKQYANKRSK